MRFLQNDITERIINEGLYIVENNSTIRETAKKFFVSKSTVHYDIQKLEKINPQLYKKVRKVLENNYSEKHIRGGIKRKNNKKLA